jgi:hypothetical protein
LPEGFFTSQEQFPAWTFVVILSATVERPVVTISSRADSAVWPKQ